MQFHAKIIFRRQKRDILLVVLLFLSSLVFANNHTEQTEVLVKENVEITGFEYFTTTGTRLHNNTDIIYVSDGKVVFYHNSETERCYNIIYLPSTAKVCYNNFTVKSPINQNLKTNSRDKNSVGKSGIIEFKQLPSLPYRFIQGYINIKAITQHESQKFGIVYHIKHHYTFYDETIVTLVYDAISKITVKPIFKLYSRPPPLIS